ncbi:unnamed protein product [Prorocentrum cordatum]|uniref:Uncharacterized protein n=1 Tax=Prorocentrum cordatum TaxID=2364126 RepID=A0ABN9XVE4_9DINO|nr:unnamed protein product [Polarella glacialis]
MWRSSAAGAAAVAAPPEALLNATRELGPAGPEVVLAVVDRGGDVQATARALLERRHWLQLVDLPRQLPAKDGGAAVTIFHFIGGACGAAGASPRRRCGRAREASLRWGPVLARGGGAAPAAAAGVLARRGVRRGAHGAPVASAPHGGCRGRVGAVLGLSSKQK